MLVLLAERADTRNYTGERLLKKIGGGLVKLSTRRR